MARKLFIFAFMKQGRVRLIWIFTELGLRLDGFGRGGQAAAAVGEAVRENGWFTPDEITGAVDAIRRKMLREEALRDWISPYPEVTAPKNVGVIMAGNIPLAGFFDMLCVLISGHNCYVKPSSKDRALIGYVASLLKDIYPPLPLYEYKDQMLDAVIASGGDNTVRRLKARYGDTATVLRGNRASAAVLTGRETEGQLAGLGRDIFSYSGLGCRNVSHVFVPESYDMERLAGALSGFGPVNRKYIHNFRQRFAVLSMQREKFVSGGFFVLRGDENFPAAVSEITYSVYGNIKDAEEWLGRNDRQVQCVVHDAASEGFAHPRSAAFGSAQEPSLGEWPDGVDVLGILTSAGNG